MDAVYPAAASALARGRRSGRTTPRLRHRTAPVTFAEIKEVDEDKEDAEPTEAGGVSAGAERRRRPDVLDERPAERLDREFAAFRRRRARRQPLREPDEPQPEPRATSEPRADSTPA